MFLAAQATSFLDTIENLGYSTWVRESPSKFAYPTVLLVHVIGMGTIAGLSALISLRLLGISPKLPVRPLERLFPLIWGAFWVNAFTGTSLLMASATKRAVDPLFYLKLVFVFTGLYVLHLTRKRVFGHLGPDDALPEGSKGLAWAGLVCWLGAIIGGRLLAYL